MGQPEHDSRGQAMKTAVIKSELAVCDLILAMILGTAPVTGLVVLSGTIALVVNLGARACQRNERHMF